MKSLSDEELWQAFRENACEAAFAEMVGRYGGLVRATTERILGRGPDAEDALQAAFLALAKQSKSTAVYFSLAGWFHRVAVRSALDIRRGNLRRRQREDEALRRAALHQAPTDRSLDEAIEKLPTALRQAVVGHYMEGRSLSEIAVQLGCSESAVSMRLTRARSALKKKLGLAPSLTLLASTSSLSADEVASILSTGKAWRWGCEPGERTKTNWLEAIPSDRWKEFLPPTASAACLVLGLASLPFILPVTAEIPPASASMTGREITAPEQTSIRRQREIASSAPPPNIAVAEHPLIIAIKSNPPWTESRAFTDVLDGTTEPLDAIRDENGKSPLHWALSLGADDYAALLMQRGASPTAPDHRGRTPLHYAVDKQSTWSILLLVLRGAALDVRDQEGHTPLAVAVSAGDLRHAEILLWAGADPQSTSATPGSEMEALLADYRSPQSGPFAHTVEQLPAFVRNPIHEAARKGDFPLLEKYMTAGPGANVRDERGRTPLHEAIFAGQAEVVFYLLMMGADPNAVDLQKRSALGATMVWLGGGLDAMRRFLLARGANPNAFREDGHTEISWSVVRDNEHGLQWLLWMKVDPRQQTQQGTPFEIAVEHGNQRILDLLRRQGVDGPERLSDDPAWLLSNAAKRGRHDMIDEALASGISVDHPDPDGSSPLMLALYRRNVETARYLLSRGANQEFRNEKSGWTPLFVTMIWDFPAMTKFREELLENGADPDVVDERGITPLMRGLWHHPTTPMKQLIEFGADLNLRDRQGRTALRRAIEEGKLDTADFLRQLGAEE
jgi:RNA polymerase sigma factor (sigma-70 family)